MCLRFGSPPGGDCGEAGDRTGEVGDGVVREMPERVAAPAGNSSPSSVHLWAFWKVESWLLPSSSLCPPALPAPALLPGNSLTPSLGLLRCKLGGTGCQLHLKVGCAGYLRRDAVRSLPPHPLAPTSWGLSILWSLPRQGRKPEQGCENPRSWQRPGVGQAGVGSAPTCSRIRNGGKCSCERGSRVSQGWGGAPPSPGASPPSGEALCPQKGYTAPPADLNASTPKGSRCQGLEDRVLHLVGVNDQFVLKL